jgi:hypothetical protein
LWRRPSSKLTDPTTAFINEWAGRRWAGGRTGPAADQRCFIQRSIEPPEAKYSYFCLYESNRLNEVMSWERIGIFVLKFTFRQLKIFIFLFLSYGIGHFCVLEKQFSSQACQFDCPDGLEDKRRWLITQQENFAKESCNCCLSWEILSI